MCCGLRLQIVGDKTNNGEELHYLVSVDIFTNGTAPFLSIKTEWLTPPFIMF